MPAETISIPLDPETAKAYNSASAEERKKMCALLAVWLHDLATAEPSALERVMDHVSRTARARGLTSELLESLLKGG